MLTIALLAQLTVVPATVTPDSTYGTAAVRDLVVRAARANAQPPEALRGYTANVESELSFSIRDTLGREHVTQIEQLASRATWSRGGAYGLHVRGFRAQSVGVPFSALSFVRSWTIPMLYGNRLQVGIEPSRGSDAVVVKGADGRRDTLPVVHPFADARDQYYRFAGGDTVAVLRTAAREIPIVRLIVTPRPESATRVAAFRGEIDLDATRAEVVRMRGQFVYPQTLAAHSLGALSMRAAGVVAVAFVEFVNVEVNGRYWLPAMERTEFQAAAELFGPERSLFRLISTIDDYRLYTAGDSADTLSPVPVRGVTFAPRDSLDAFDGWHESLGTETASVTGGDFDDLAPDLWRRSGPPLLLPFPRRTSDIVRYNRVEGAYTGLAGELRFRDAAPGLTARAFAGWAWAERTPRGGASVSLRRDAWSYELRGERQLASTNDFRLPLDGGESVGALFASVDDQDYVDRRYVAIAATHGRGADPVVSDAEVGAFQDRPEFARLQHGFFSHQSFRPNRGALAGSYVRAAGDIELHPGVSGDFLRAGIGARLHGEYARGELEWTRFETSLSARQYWGNAWLAGHAEGGVVLGDRMPPQSLFELGGNEGLPGYGYKQFGGDHAALLRLASGYTFPVFRRPVRFIRGYFLPGLSPGIAAGVQGGWAEAATPGARTALSLLGPSPAGPLVSVPTNGGRATVDVRLTFFSGAASVGAARPVDHAAPWRLVFVVGEMY